MRIHGNYSTKSKETLSSSESFQKKFLRYGWDDVYDDAVEKSCTRCFSGMVYTAKRVKLGSKAGKKPPKNNERRYPKLPVPGEKVTSKKCRIVVWRAA